ICRVLERLASSSLSKHQERARLIRNRSSSEAFVSQGAEDIMTQRHVNEMLERTFINLKRLFGLPPDEEPIPPEAPASIEDEEEEEEDAEVHAPQRFYHEH